MTLRWHGKLLLVQGKDVGKSMGDDKDKIRSLISQLSEKEVMTESSTEINDIIADAIDRQTIGQNEQLKARRKQIEERGALEEEHVKARSAHPSYPERNLENPVVFTHKNVIDAQTILGDGTKELNYATDHNSKRWADPGEDQLKLIGDPKYDPRALQNPATPGYAYDPAAGKISARETFVTNSTGEKKLILNEKGLPVNQVGETGIEGRGLLGKYGPNRAADPVITEVNPETGRVEMLVVWRKVEKKWAIPGGMVDPGEKSSKTAWRELSEEAANIPIGNLDVFILKLSNWNKADDKLKRELSEIQGQLGQEDVKTQKEVVENYQKAFLSYKEGLTDEASVESKVFENVDFMDFHNYCTKPDALRAYLDELVKNNMINGDDRAKAEALFNNDQIKPQAAQVEAMKVMMPIIDKLRAVYEDGFIKKVFSSENATKIYEGYVDDNRNTDNAWMETSAWEWEIVRGSPEADIMALCESGDDAGAKKMVDPMHNELFASHNPIAALKCVGPRSKASKTLKPNLIGENLVQRVEARDMLLVWPKVVFKA